MQNYGSEFSSLTLGDSIHPDGDYLQKADDIAQALRLTDPEMGFYPPGSSANEHYGPPYVPVAFPRNSPLGSMISGHSSNSGANLLLMQKIESLQNQVYVTKLPRQQTLRNQDDWKKARYYAKLQIQIYGAIGPHNWRNCGVRRFPQLCFPLLLPLTDSIRFRSPHLLNIWIPTLEWHFFSQDAIRVAHPDPPNERANYCARSLFLCHGCIQLWHA